MTEDEPNPWADIVGPCYTVTSMARTLGWTEAEVMEAGNDLRLLMLRTDDDVHLFPSFQLHDGKVVAGLEEVLLVLQTGVASPWTWAQWLNPTMTRPATSRASTRVASRRRYAMPAMTPGRGIGERRYRLEASSTPTTSHRPLTAPRPAILRTCRALSRAQEEAG